jgi:hypothetical protein
MPDMTCPTCTFPAGCTCKPASLIDAAIQEMRDAAAEMDAAVDRGNRATAQLATALVISNANHN